MRASAARKLPIAAAFVVLFFVGAVFVFAVPVFAHARLVEASPADGDELTGSPMQIQLRFSEPIEAAFDPIEVRGEDGERVDLDNARLDPEDSEVVVVDLEENLPAGRYGVAWRVTSEDGHPINDEYAFISNPSPDADSPDERTPVKSVSEDASPGFSGAGILFGGALAVAATVAFVVFRRN